MSGAMYSFTYKNTNGLWVNVTTLTHKDHLKPKIVLLPMIHVADGLFFEEMYYEQFCCDVVLEEGVVHPVGRFANLFYRAFAALKNVGASAQHRWSSQSKQHNEGWRADDVQWHSPKVAAPTECTVYQDYPEIDPALMKRATRFVKADVTAKVAREALKALPLWTYLAVPFAFLGALVTLRFKSRLEIIDALSNGRHGTHSDGKSDADRAWNVFSRFAGETRDNHLAKVLFDEIKSPANASKTICVKFGAAHMYPLLTKLRRRLGYKISEKRAVLAWATKTAAQGTSPVECYGVAQDRYARIMWEPAMRRGATENALHASWQEEPARTEWTLAKGTPKVVTTGFSTRGKGQIGSSS
jgi:hypothetical protein